ncbi:MAG: TauD/TfdA family dioxygenase [Proteobacteria bacterium]|nr:TauD/TfdA family dioxygenase [Pseudomonadota bacterium]MDA1325486.1 TauD/TfdA family dioxygenase [Pseudomonadota bacterium]
MPMVADVLPFKVSPLSGALGATIGGIDLSQYLDAATVAALRRAWLENVIVVFPGQTLTETDQERFCRNFGELEIVRSARAQDAGHPSIMLITNVRDTGKVTALENGEMYFHYDQCYYEVPADATILYAMEVPKEGGHTLFANCYTAYETLPGDVKRRIDGLKALNYYDYRRDPTVRPGTLNPDAPRWAHPVVRTHPETGRKALFINRLMTISIEGMDAVESGELLTFLFDHMEQARFIYEHKWTVGDLMMWDNRCSIHARTDFDPSQRRMMRRITVRGGAPVV